MLVFSVYQGTLALFLRAQKRLKITKTVENYINLKTFNYKIRIIKKNLTNYEYLKIRYLLV